MNRACTVRNASIASRMSSAEWAGDSGKDKTWSRHARQPGSLRESGRGTSSAGAPGESGCSSRSARRRARADTVARGTRTLGIDPDDVQVQGCVSRWSRASGVIPSSSATASSYSANCRTRISRCRSSLSSCTSAIEASTSRDSPCSRARRCRRASRHRAAHQAQLSIDSATSSRNSRPSTSTP